MAKRRMHFEKCALEIVQERVSGMLIFFYAMVLCIVLCAMGG